MLEDQAAELTAKINSSETGQDLRGALLLKRIDTQTEAAKLAQELKQSTEEMTATRSKGPIAQTTVQDAQNIYAGLLRDYNYGKGPVSADQVKEAWGVLKELKTKATAMPADMDIKKSSAATAQHLETIVKEGVKVQNGP
jgi:hypothetical protein